MFSLPFKKLRRKSESQASTKSTGTSSHASNSTRRSHTTINNNTSTELGLQRSNTSIPTRKRAMSNTISKRLSFFSTHSSNDDSNSAFSYLSDSIQHENPELTRFKSLNQDKFPKELLQYLRFQGLSSPDIVCDNGSIKISVSSSGETVFLPSQLAISEEEQNLELNNSTNNNNSTGNNNSNSTPTHRPSDTPSNTNNSSNSPNSDDIEPISHTFAITIAFMKPTPVATIKTQLQAICDIQWPKGVPNNRSVTHEKFSMGSLNWDLNLGNYNYFVPFMENAIMDDDDDDDDDEKVRDELDQSKFLTEQRIHSKLFQIHSTEHIINENYLPNEKHDPFILGAMNGNLGSVNFPPGYYVFLLPTLFDPSIPESLITTKSRVAFKLRTIVGMKGKNYSYGNHDVNVIRAPPTSGITTVDKPVYVNKIWNDSLSYEISFPKKYVPIGSELPIKLKLVPLKKDLQIKRIKINVLEYITYTSKNLEYEYDEEVDSPEESYLKNKTERAVTLLEVRTKSRMSHALREEVVEEAGVNENLLSCCYNKPVESSSSDDVDIIGPLTVQSYLSFVKPQLSTKQYPHESSKILLHSVIHTSKQHPQITKAFKTKITNQNQSIKTRTFIRDFEDGLYPDTFNNKYINVEHKLQISLRISKKETKSGKLHHYEVMIDTPLFLLNSLCVPDNVELPAYETTRVVNEEDEYDEDVLPSFEEATSPMNSPSLVPFTGGNETVNYLSRTSTIGGGGLDSGFENIDNIVTNDTSDISLDRRMSSTKTDILNSFRRTLSHRPEDECAAASDSSGSDKVGVLPMEPPSYNEAIPLLSDGESDGSDEVMSDSESELREEIEGFNESMDLTEQFTNAIYNGR